MRWIPTEQTHLCAAAAASGRRRAGTIWTLQSAMPLSFRRADSGYAFLEGSGDTTAGVLPRKTPKGAERASSEGRGDGGQVRSGAWQLAHFSAYCFTGVLQWGSKKRRSHRCRSQAKQWSSHGLCPGTRLRPLLSRCAPVKLNTSLPKLKDKLHRQVRRRKVRGAVRKCGLVPLRLLMWRQRVRQC